FPFDAGVKPVLVEPDRTPYDWSFRLFGFRVRVHPLFWLGSAIFGWPLMERGPEFLLVWIVIVFVSILIHEFGHAWAFRLYGVHSYVVLYIFGGLAVPNHSLAGRWKRAFVSFAGPLAGFVLAGIIFLSNTAFEWSDRSDLAKVLYRNLIWVNLYWG